MCVRGRSVRHTCERWSVRHALPAGPRGGVQNHGRVPRSREDPAACGGLCTQPADPGGSPQVRAGGPPRPAPPLRGHGRAHFGEAREPCELSQQFWGCTKQAKPPFPLPLGMEAPPPPVPSPPHHLTAWMSQLRPQGDGSFGRERVTHSHVGRLESLGRRV